MSTTSLRKLYAVENHLYSYLPQPSTWSYFMQTNIVVQSEGSRFNVPGELSEQEVRNAYGSSIPNLSSMVCNTTRDETGVTHTFSLRTGNKG